ncbi:hypothetical protein L1887_13774 [Cichorium endivia]|nr:hypothetical protein L1887_13774 [Cichorium endivia]
MASLCKLHGWELHDYPIRVYDAVIFSNEIDMLTIRCKEINPHITQFVLLESNSTHAGYALPPPSRTTCPFHCWLSRLETANQNTSSIEIPSDTIQIHTPYGWTRLLEDYAFQSPTEAMAITGIDDRRY